MPSTTANGPERLFEPLLGRPAWMVKRGYGSFVTMEFGDPRLEVGEVRSRKLRIEGAPESAPSRPTKFGGRWHLWIYCCDWHLELDGIELAHNESDDRTMHWALWHLNGHELQDVAVSQADGATVFTFDLGCTLRTAPSPPGIYEFPTEQWMLYDWDGGVLTVREDGTFAHGSGHARPNERRWRPIG